MKIAEYMNDTNQLTKWTWFLFVTVIGVLLAFASFYYFDRYIHLGDKNPLDVGKSALIDKVEADPDAPEPRLALAETYLRSQHYPEAIDQAEQVLAVYPESDRAMLVLGMANMFSGETELGVAYLERFASVRRLAPAAELDSALEMALYYMGDSYLKLGRPADASKVLSEALAITPSDADALYLLGLAHFHLGEPEIALTFYQKVVRFVPDFTEAYAGMEDCYKALNQPDYVIFAQGMQAFSQKDFESARQQLSSVVERLPDYSPVYVGLGLVYEKLGDLQAAKTMLERGIGIDGSDLVATNALQRINNTLADTP